MIKKVVSIIICVIMVCLMSVSYADHSREGHDDLLELILFGDDHYSMGKDEETKARVEALKCASYLCLDQFNHNGIKELQILKDFGVHNLPGKIEEIDFNGNSGHREYTHRGWEYSYATDRAHWDIRKRIMRETVNHIFNFGFGSGRYFGIDRYDKRCDSFAAVVYYIHVLQDHLEKKEYKPLIMPIARENDNIAVIDELLKHFKVLFADQTSSRVYKTLVDDMTIVLGEAKELVGSGGLKTEEKLEAYYNCCDKLKGILKDGLHILLNRCDWFAKAFPMN